MTRHTIPVTDARYDMEPDCPPAIGVFLIAALCFWAGLFLGAIVAIFAGWVV